MKWFRGDTAKRQRNTSCGTPSSAPTDLVARDLGLVVHGSDLLPAQDHPGVCDIPHHVSRRLAGRCKHTNKSTTLISLALVIDSAAQVIACHYIGDAQAAPLCARHGSEAKFEKQKEGKSQNGTEMLFLKLKYLLLVLHSIQADRSMCLRTRVIN